MEKLRLLVVLEATLGGTRKYIIDLLERLDRTKFDIEFVYSTVRADQAFLDGLPALEALGIRLTELPMARGLAPYKDINGVLQIWNIIRLRKPHILHCHSSKAGFLGRLAATCSRTHPMTVFTPHGLSTHVSPVFWLWEKLAARFTDMAIAVSDSEYDDFKRQGIFRKGASRLVSLGVDCSREYIRLDIRHRLDIPSNAIVVASVGYLSDIKNPVGLFSVAKAVLEKDRNIHFVWIGNGELQSAVERFLQMHGLRSNCHLLGWQACPPQLLGQCDIFAHTSRYESFGYVLCEAMLEQLPVVATDVMGVNSIVKHGTTGYLVKDRDWTAFADRILALATNPDTRLQMGHCGRERVRMHFNLDNMINETEALYEDLIAHSAQARGHYVPH